MGFASGDKRNPEEGNLFGLPWIPRLWRIQRAQSTSIERVTELAGFHMLLPNKNLVPMMGKPAEKKLSYRFASFGLISDRELLVTLEPGI